MPSGACGGNAISYPLTASLVALNPLLDAEEVSVYARASYLCKACVEVSPLQCWGRWQGKEPRVLQPSCCLTFPDDYWDKHFECLVEILRTYTHPILQRETV